MAPLPVDERQNDLTTTMHACMQDADTLFGTTIEPVLLIFVNTTVRWRKKARDTE